VVGRGASGSEMEVIDRIAEDVIIEEGSYIVGKMKGGWKR
jgi:hypothetical protein